MYQRKTKRRLYYLPGLISLVLLPLLCIWYINPAKRLKKVRMMEIIVPDPPTNDRKKSMFSISSIPKRINHTIKLTGNEVEDKIKLNYAQLELRRLVQEKDTINGLHIVFSDKTKYWEMIKAIDICIIEEASIYALYKNDFWILNTRRISDSNENIPFLDCLLCGDVVFSKPTSQENFLTELKFNYENIKYIIHSVQVLWLSYILLLIMFLLTIWRFVKI